MNPAIIDFVKERWPLYLPSAFARRVVRGKSLLRQPTQAAGLKSYEKNLASWQWLRELVLIADERRMCNWVVENYGYSVPFGPFKGLKYESCKRELSAAARLGFYELELHPIIEEIVARNYRNVLNVGCAFGYYAVGLALRTKGCKIHAFDIQPRERARCRALAEENGVADRVVIGERFEPAMFADFAGEPTLVLCDIEGGEVELLDPEQSKDLARCDILVELHDVHDASISTLVPGRFQSTHDVQIVREGDHAPLELPETMKTMGSLERLVAVHGAQRWGATPWAYMRSLNPPT